MLSASLSSEVEEDDVEASEGEPRTLQRMPETSRDFPVMLTTESSVSSAELPEDEIEGDFGGTSIVSSATSISTSSLCSSATCLSISDLALKKEKHRKL